jgi:hypothetical protein
MVRWTGFAAVPANEACAELICASCWVADAEDTEVFDLIAGEEGPEPPLRPVLVPVGNSDSLACVAPLPVQLVAPLHCPHFS